MKEWKHPEEGGIVKVTGPVSKHWAYLIGIRGLVLSTKPRHDNLSHAEVMLFLNDGKIEIMDFIDQCWPGLGDLTVIEE